MPEHVSPTPHCDSHIGLVLYQLLERSFGFIEIIEGCYSDVMGIIVIRDFKIVISLADKLDCHREIVAQSCGICYGNRVIWRL